MGWARAIDGALRSLARVWRFRTTPRRRPRHKPPSRRRLLFEMPEPRLLLSASPTSVASVTGGVLVANLTEGADSVVFEKIRGNAGNNVIIGGPGSDVLTGGGGTDKIVDIDRPLVLLPGIGASYPIDDITVVNAWFDHRGVLPEQLEIDPLAKVYADMIQTLKNVGYVEGETLFLAPWDFRLSVAPRPTDATYDWHIDGLSAENLTDGTYQYAVDYFGHAMDRAVNAWKSEYGVAPVDIDVLTHSTGGLIARSYIQSDAYNTALPG